MAKKAADTGRAGTSLPAASVDLIYIDPLFNSSRNYEVFWGETKEKHAFEDRHESTRAYIDYSQQPPRRTTIYETQNALQP